MTCVLRLGWEVQFWKENPGGQFRNLPSVHPNLLCRDMAKLYCKCCPSNDSRGKGTRTSKATTTKT